MLVLRRSQPKEKQFLADSQAANKPNRSGTDNIAIKWKIANITNVTGIDTSSALGTIRRETLITISKI